MVKRKSSMTIGVHAEKTAAAFLLKLGFTILAHNFRYQSCEIDIVAKDKEELVFVEVKFRNSHRFGAPEESVTPQKQERVRRAAEGYVLENQLTDVSCRFDVVAIMQSAETQKITHYRNAF